MKNTIINMMLAVLFLTSCSSDTDENEINLDIEQLTQEEIDDLLFLREEEKLARDVYLYAYDKYGFVIFNNIANSESQHMNSVLQLLNEYDLTDSASDIRGEFNNSVLQTIYNDLIEQVNISLLEALRVGDLIEDLDINDLNANEQRTDKPDLLAVYGLLKCGSRNHLRIFNTQLLLMDGSYSAQFISQEEFDAIVSTSNEQCAINY